MPFAQYPAFAQREERSRRAFHKMRRGQGQGQVHSRIIGISISRAQHPSVTSCFLFSRETIFHELRAYGDARVREILASLPVSMKVSPLEFSKGTASKRARNVNEISDPTFYRHGNCSRACDEFPCTGNGEMVGYDCPIRSCRFFGEQNERVKVYEAYVLNQPG